MECYFVSYGMPLEPVTLYLLPDLLARDARTCSRPLLWLRTATSQSNTMIDFYSPLRARQRMLVGEALLRNPA